MPVPEQHAYFSVPSETVDMQLLFDWPRLSSTCTLCMDGVSGLVFHPLFSSPLQATGQFNMQLARM